MDTLLYLAVRSVIAGIQLLPLTLVGTLGRFGGSLFYWLDARHRKVALKNLTLCFGTEKSAAEIRAIALENFRRIGENYASAIKTASMSSEALQPHFKILNTEKLFAPTSSKPRSCVVAIGHFGNFELFARFGKTAPQFRRIATYRGLPQPSLNRLMQSLRNRSGCEFLERRTDAGVLKKAMNEGGVLLGLLADQHAGRSGIRVPFFGHECSTSTAPAVLALRYDCLLYTAICYRVGLGKWQIELNDEIPLCKNGEARSVEEITNDINRAFETAIRRDPANWFWVHNRWKPVSNKPIAK